MLSDFQAFEKFFRLPPTEPSDDWIDPQELKHIEAQEEEILDDLQGPDTL